MSLGQLKETYFHFKYFCDFFLLIFEKFCKEIPSIFLKFQALKVFYTYS